MKEESGAQAEIPSTGIPVYVKAWIEAPVEDQAMWARIGSDYDSVSEYFTSNNTTSPPCTTWPFSGVSRSPSTTI